MSRNGSLFGKLVVKLAFLGFVAMVVSACWWAISVAQRQARAGWACRHSSHVLRVRVPADVVGYARANGWPVVLRVRMRQGSPLLYDHGGQAETVRHAARRLCPDQRFRLSARR